ncbi:response regulator transcription factor [Paenibacillus hexagrammi]|uniref:Response regulator transcription factor n=1 Tax=Paenibacillus hexagrammi TaxID=2908839 RepID=A0ABY3SP25_9BACL|nr:response regulator transcription factor [Paenibacillus sp. YPD9-1]UJF34846.1 response regulator transcription factor [Paenibacillus sp. YPD9-1]
MWKIAIVDDDFQVLRGLKHIIPWDELHAELAGEAIDGEQGIELVRREEPDIVITDLYMPGISGIEMIEQLRSEGYQGRFVILSGYTDFEYARQAIRLGVEDYLNKPITVEQIRKVLFRVTESLEESNLEKMEKNELQSFVRHYEKQISQDQLASLLNGTIRAGLSDLKLPHPEIWWTERDQQVVILELSKTERVSNISNSDWHLFRYAITNITTEVLAQEWPESDYLWLFGPYSAMVLHIEREETREYVEERLNHICDTLIQHMMQYLGLTIQAGRGQRKSSWTELKQSADEAFEALDESEGRSLGVEFVRQLAQLLTSGEEEEIRGHIQAFITQQEASGHSADMKIFYKVLAAELWTLIQYAAQQAGKTLAGASDDSAIVQADTIINRSDLEAFVQAKLKLIVLKKEPAIGQKHKAAVEFMISYIHEHYAEDITLDDLAGQLFISKNYLNQLFKKVTGETFMNYVIRVRLEKAKALLLEGNLLIYEVAESVGYQNVPYFSTLFKKYTGMNPSDVLKK